MVADHRRHAGIADERGAQRAERIAVSAAALHEIERRRGLEQPLSALAWQVDPFGDPVDAARPRGQQLEQVDLHAGGEDLRIDEAGGEVEE